MREGTIYEIRSQRRQDDEIKRIDDRLVLTEKPTVRFKERQVRIQRGTELKGLVFNAFILLAVEPMRSHPKNEAGRIELETCE